MKIKLISILIFFFVVSNINFISIGAIDVDNSRLNIDPENQELKKPGMIDNENWDYV